MVSAATMAQDHGKVDWKTDFNEAKALAKKSGKPILILFTGSDWCKPCKMLKADFFNSEDFGKKANDFVMLYVDFPKNRSIITPEQFEANKKLNETYKVRGLPTVMAVDANGEVIEKVVGYNAQRDTSRHFKFLEKVMKK